MVQWHIRKKYDDKIVKQKSFSKSKSIELPLFVFNL